MPTTPQWRRFVAVIVVLLTVVLLRGLVRQQRWAWILLVGSDVLTVPSTVEGKTGTVYVILNVVDLLLLVSPPMWRHIWCWAPAADSAVTGASA